MEYLKGWITNSVEEYEAKQAEIAKGLKVERYAGIILNAAVIPSIHLKNGGYFIPYIEGADTITKEDILILDD